MPRDRDAQLRAKKAAYMRAYRKGPRKEELRKWKREWMRRWRAARKQELEMLRAKVQKESAGE